MRDERSEGDTPGETEAERERRTRLALVGMGLQFGGTIVGALVVFLLGGVWLDHRLGTKPLFLLVGLVLAFIAIGYNLYELATFGTKGRGARPAARGTATGQAHSARAIGARAWDDEDDGRDEDEDWPVRRGAGGHDARRDDGAGNRTVPRD